MGFTSNKMSSTEPSKAEPGDPVSRPKIQTFDDILPYVGEAGRYQAFLFVVLLPFTIVYAFLYFAQFFITLVPGEYWCRVPELEAANFTQQEQISLAIPPAGRAEAESDAKVLFSRCTMYAVNYTEILARNITEPQPDWPIGRCEHGWNYNLTNIPYKSIAAELDWVCEKTLYGAMAQSMFFVGSIIGGLVFGYIADHYGRIPALVACNSVGFFGSFATTFCKDFISFAICRMIVGTSFDNCFNILFIIVIEFVGPKYRTIFANMSFGIYFAVASSILPWIAYWIADWRILSVVSALPLVVAFITPWIVPESARWYITNGQIDKAIEMLKKFERVNRKKVDPEVYEEFRKTISAQNAQTGNRYTVFDLFKLPRLAKITVILVVYWWLNVFIFDGHVWNLKLLHPDVFTSFSLASLTELPAALALGLFLDRWGRRWMGFFAMIGCGLLSFLAIYTPEGAPTLAVVILARFGVNVTANIGFQYAAEMLPTVVRAQGVSLIHIIGYLGHITGPYIVYLAKLTPSGPLITLGVLSLLDAFLTLFLPETLDQELPETLEEGNNFGKEQSFWWFPCIKRSPEKKKKYRRKIGQTNAGFNPGSLTTLESTKL